MIPGLMVLTRAPRLPQRTASAITRNDQHDLAGAGACPVEIALRRS